MFILSSLKLNVVINLGEYINAVVSRIVIGTLDLKQFLPKLKYFCWRQQGLDPLPPPCQQPSEFRNPPSAADVICERSLYKPIFKSIRPKFVSRRGTIAPRTSCAAGPTAWGKPKLAILSPKINAQFCPSFIQQKPYSYIFNEYVWNFLESM